MACPSVLSTKGEGRVGVEGPAGATSSLEVEGVFHFSFMELGCNDLDGVTMTSSRIRCHQSHCGTSRHDHVTLSLASLASYWFPCFGKQYDQHLDRRVSIHTRTVLGQ